MAIAFTCECGKKYRAKDEFAGRTAYCSECRREFVIPVVSETVTPREQPIFQAWRFEGETGEEKLDERSDPFAASLVDKWAKAKSLVRCMRIPRRSAKRRPVSPVDAGDHYVGPVDAPRSSPPVQTAVHYAPAPTQQNTTIVYVNQPTSSGLAVAGFTFALLGFLTCGCLSPIGLTLSVMSLDHKPRGLAIAGCILGGIGSLWVFWFIGLWLVGGTLLFMR
jgi:hypothetical protein